MNILQKGNDSSWDFRSEHTKEHTHCYHTYPAMMIPQVAHRIIEQYGKKAQSLFDPYCGTGTSLVEAHLCGINAFGTDLNPLARLIAEAKTTKIELSTLDTWIKEFNDFVFSMSFGIDTHAIAIPTFKNIDFWFTHETKKQLASIKQFINHIKDDGVKKFFSRCF